MELNSFYIRSISFTLKYFAFTREIIANRGDYRIRYLRLDIFEGIPNGGMYLFIYLFEAIFNAESERRKCWITRDFLILNAFPAVSVIPDSGERPRRGI